MSSRGKFLNCFVINRWRGWRGVINCGVGAIAVQAGCVRPPELVGGGDREGKWGITQINFGYGRGKYTLTSGTFNMTFFLSCLSAAGDVRKALSSKDHRLKKVLIT